MLENDAYLPLVVLGVVPQRETTMNVISFTFVQNWFFISYSFMNMDYFCKVVGRRIEATSRSQSIIYLKFDSSEEKGNNKTDAGHSLQWNIIIHLYSRKQEEKESNHGETRILLKGIGHEEVGYSEGRQFGVNQEFNRYQVFAPEFHL